MTMSMPQDLSTYSPVAAEALLGAGTRPAPRSRTGSHRFLRGIAFAALTLSGGAVGGVAGLSAVDGTPAIRSLAAGAAHSCALSDDGRVQCWGDNSDGQLGDGTRMVRFNPVLVGGLGRSTEVALGASHSCARLEDGTVRCWGGNSEGQLGDGTKADRTTPTEVTGLHGVTELALGAAHSCALLGDGTVRCWGSNSEGQLGDGTNRGSVLPKTVSGLTHAVQIAVGTSHSCARLEDGAVRCWGGNYSGQLGDGTTVSRTSPTLALGLHGVTQLALGSSHACALVASGAAYCWGDNSHGQLGDGSVVNRGTPIAPVMGLVGATALSLGSQHTCARLASGELHCWGGNYDGQIADGTSVERHAPVVSSALKGAEQVVLGRGHGCALFGKGVRCWGENTAGQLGVASFSAASSPVSVTWCSRG